MSEMKSKKISLIVFAFAVLFATLVFVTVECASGTTPPEEAWNKTFGGANGDYAYSVQQTADGGYILAGVTRSYGAGSNDAWLVKTDSDGNEQWNKTFGGASNEFADSVQQTADGGYILAGETCPSGTNSDFWLVKTDSDGNEQWNKTFGGTDFECAHSVQQTKDGGYILAGWTQSYGAGVTDVWLVKTDSDGNKQWDKTFGGASNEFADSVQQTTDGGYIIAGETRSYGAGSNDVWLVKTDSDGNERWNKTFGGTGSDHAWAVQETKDGGYILAGYTCPSGTNSDFLLIKTDSDGNEQWNKTFGGTDFECAYSVQQTKDGGYILAGWTQSYGAGYQDFWLVKTDSDGNEQWNKTFGGVSTDEAWAVQETKDSGYILVGWTQSYGAGHGDVWLIKTDSGGNVQWAKTFGGANWDRAMAAQETKDGGYILAGYRQLYSACGSDDFWLIKTDSDGNEQWNKTFGGSNGGGGTLSPTDQRRWLYPCRIDEFARCWFP